jgi:hypothetical protein
MVEFLHPVRLASMNKELLLLLLLLLSLANRPIRTQPK